MIENNKLIAEFLGLDVSDTNGIFKKGLGVAYLTDDIFLKDWNWLMLVVEKIESIEMNDGRTFTIDFYRDSVLIFEYGMYTNEIIFTEGKGRFENLYNACVEFIKWYNENLTSQTKNETSCK